MLKLIKPVSLILLAAAMCSVQNAYAVSETKESVALSKQQTTKVTGSVEDLFGPVTGASVVVKGTTIGTITDLDGKFTLDVKSGQTIVVSFVGYVPQEIKYTGQASLNINLEEDSQALGEVVVMGYGGVQKAKTLTASAVTVKMDQIAKLPVTTMSEGLGGRVTGVTTQQSSGAPGETTKIWIRGGSKILYVIDDVVLETEQGEIFFNRLRPDDIASMSILKDASATAIYGPRANDGVVVIATKKGAEGSVNVTYNQKISMMTPSYRTKAMSAYDYAQRKNDIYAANYEENPAYNNEEMSKYYLGELYKQGVGREDMLGLVNNRYGIGYNMNTLNDLFSPVISQGKNIQDYYTTYDPWDSFDHVQPMYQSNVSISGGSDRVRYYSSLGYLNQKGVSDTFGYEQINVMLNTDAFLLKDKSLKFTLNLNGNTSTQKKPAAGEGVFNSAMLGHDMPTRPDQWSTGLPRQGSTESILRTGFDNTNDYRLQANMALKYSLPWVPGLSVSAAVNFNTSYTMNKNFQHDQENVYSNPASTEPSSYNANNATLFHGWSNYLLTTGVYQAEYTKSIGKHNFFAMGNYQSQVRTQNNSSSKAKGYATTFVPQIDAGAEFMEHKGNEVRWGSSSVIGRLTYDYDSKYLFQYSVNYNGSLSYSPAKRWGFFQAASAGWVMSEEKFFKENINPDVMSMLKIRGGYGIVGNELGSPFSFLNQYKQEGGNVLFGDNMSPNVAWKESHVASDLTWSSSRQISGGVDFELLKSRLSGSFDTYLYMNNGDSMDMNPDEIRSDILGMPNIPQINAPFETSRKGGIEFSLNWNDKIGEVGYRIGVNYSYWDQRVTRHTDKSTDYYYKGFNDIGLRNLHETYGTTYTTNGLFGSYDQMYNSILHATRNKSIGTYVVRDLNNDGVIGLGDYEWQNSAGSTPLTQYGVTLGGSYKGFDVELFFQGAANVAGTMASPYRNQQGYMWNYGQYGYEISYNPNENNTDAILGLPVPDGNGWGYNSIDRWIFNASYIKLKNISVRYDMKQYVLKNNSFIKGLDLSFVVTNAFTWANSQYPYKNLADPEFITTGAGIYNDGGTLGGYPTQRSYTLGVTVTL